MSICCGFNLKLSIEIQEGIEGELVPEIFEAAAKKLEEYRNIQEKTGLKDRHMELLADSENPYRLKDFSKDDKLTIKMIKEKIAEVS